MNTNQAKVAQAATKPDKGQESVATQKRQYIPLGNHTTIMRILQETADQRASLSIKLELDSRMYVYETTIRHVDTDNEEMLLNNMMPGTWREHVTEPRDVEVSCTLPSGLFRFWASIEPFEADANNQFCVLSIPRLLYRNQLRSSYRVQIPVNSGRISLPLESRVLEGICVDLSLEGCCCVFRDNLLIPFDINEKLPEMIMVLGSQMKFTTAAVIRRIDRTNKGFVRIGMSFENLNQDIQQQLQICLTNLQRQQLQKQK